MTLELIENQENINGKIDHERKEAREKLNLLIGLVNARYRRPGSTIAGNEALLKSFEAHNSDILDSAIELGLNKDLEGDDLLALEIAAVLHDLAKADLPPAKTRGINNFVVVNHHQMAATEIDSILKEKQPEILGHDPNNQDSHSRAEKVIGLVKSAIICHMGPSPGFMANTLEKVNDDLEKRGQPAIIHPVPNNNVSKILLAADMRALASPSGIQKILNLRAANFVKEDEATCVKYGKAGLEIFVPEAALISALQSAREAVAMVKDVCGEKEAGWIQSTFDDAIKKQFIYPKHNGDAEILFSDVEDKISRYEKVKDIFEMCERTRELIKIISESKESSAADLKKLSTELFGCAMVLEHLFKIKKNSSSGAIDFEKILQFSQKLRELAESNDFWRILRPLPTSSSERISVSEGTFAPLTFAKSEHELEALLHNWLHSLDMLALENFKSSGKKGN